MPVRTPQVPRKLVHVTTVPMTLGFLRGQISFMKQNGVEVQVVSSPGAMLDDFGAEENVRTRGVPMKRSISPLSDILAVGRLYRVFREEQPDIVHAHTPKAGLLATVAALLAGVSGRIFHLHGLPNLSGSRLTRWLVWLSHFVSCTAANKVLCVSPSLQQQVISEGLCAADKIEVLHRGSIDGVDAAERFNPATQSGGLRDALCRKYGMDPRGFILAYVGRLAGDKGMRELAEAWETVRSSREPCYLILAGEPDERDPLPAGILNALAGDSSVRLLGWIKDTAALYEAVDAVVLPTYREGLGMVLLEAAAMRKPTIASDVPGCQDAVIDGVTGTLVRPKDPGALAEAILRYAHNPGLRMEHGEAGRARVLIEFLPHDLWRATLDRYVALLSESGLPSRAGEGPRAISL